MGAILDFGREQMNKAKEHGLQPTTQDTAPLFGGSAPPAGTSLVNNPGGPARTNTPEEEAANQAAQYQAWVDQQAADKTKREGFLAPLLQQHGQAWDGMSNAMGHQTPPPPQSGWSNQPGKGPVWMEPHRVINREATNLTDKNWAMGEAPSGSPFKGNRI